MRPRSSVRYSAYRDRSRQRPLASILRFAVVFLVVYLIVTSVLIHAVRVGSDMMAPTLHAGDRLLVSPLVYGPRFPLFGWVLPGFRDPDRGDLVVLRPPYMPGARFSERLANPFLRIVTLERIRTDDGETWRSALQVKRIAGIPGDTVRVEGFRALIKPAGAASFEPLSSLRETDFELELSSVPDDWAAEDPFGAASGEVLLGDDEYFVLADNRTAGLDSRHWGVVTGESIHGYVLLRFWPIVRAGAP